MQDLQDAVSRLGPAELAEFRDWFRQYTSDLAKNSLRIRLNRIYTFLIWPTFWLGLSAFVLGVVAIVRCSAYDVRLTTHKPEAAFYVIFWTLMPPLWFGFENAILYDRAGLFDLSPGQKKAAALWAAILAAILLLVK